MTNRPKQRGTAAETAVLRHVREQGFPWAHRLALTGNADQGDISLLPGNLVILEVKAHASAATGQPGDAQLADWMRQTSTERVNAGADYGLLVVKRKGTTDPGRWFGFLEPAALFSLLGSTGSPPAGMSGWPCLPFADVILLLRQSGYGTAIEEVA